MTCVNYKKSDQDFATFRRNRILLELTNATLEELSELNHGYMKILQSTKYTSTSNLNDDRRALSSTKCVTSSAALTKAVQSAKPGSTPTRITICTKKIPLGKYSRRLTNTGSRFLQSNQTGIDISNKNILFNCKLRTPNTRCILDGLGESRIFYGFNANVTFDKIMFHNGSATEYDFDGSGGALLLRDSSVRIKRCGFFHNKATFGGAVSISNSEVIVDNNIVGLMNHSTLNRTIFAYNEASIRGGALDLTDLTTSAIKHVVFRSNQAKDMVRCFYYSTFGSLRRIY
jgi:hypothetical protein